MSAPLSRLTRAVPGASGEGKPAAALRPGHSIRTRFFAAIAATALLFIVCVSLLNIVFYDDYYLAERQRALRAFNTSLSQTYDGTVESVFDLLVSAENSQGVRLSILTREGAVRYDSVFQQQGGRTEDNLFSSWTLALMALQKADLAAIRKEGFDMVTISQGAGRETYLCLVGTLGQDYLVARLPLSYMEQSSAINSFFLLVTGGITLLVCLVVAAVLAGRFTRPIIEMSGIAEAMARLDFSRCYTGHADDEIGQLGQSINAMRDHLEEAIGDLRRTNEQLAREIEEKERIDAMRREFIVNVSHELKTPIALIQGYAEGLQAGVAQSDEDRDFYCETIADEAARMNTMVTQLLSLSRLELGREELRPEPVELAGLARESVEKTAVLRAGRDLDVHCPETPVTVVTDAGLVGQVLLNYLTNAIRYTPDGGKIVLSAEALPDGGALLAVENEGEPVAPDELDLIWEKFYRTDKARSRASGGTGVGLSIVRAAAGTLGGQCGAEALPHGMRFTLTLPPAPPAGHVDGD